MTLNEKKKNIEGLMFLGLLCLTVPAANWIIGQVGTTCSFEFLLGQIVGKAWTVPLVIPLVAYLRRRDERLGITAP
jgi:hypothetical protein